MCSPQISGYRESGLLCLDGVLHACWIYRNCCCREFTGATPFSALGCCASLVSTSGCKDWIRGIRDRLLEYLRRASLRQEDPDKRLPRGVRGAQQCFCHPHGSNSFLLLWFHSGVCCHCRASALELRNCIFFRPSDLPDYGAVACALV